MSVIRLALGQLLLNFLYVLIMEEHHICFGQTLVNIVRNKSYGQSSSYKNAPPYRAANGNTDGDFYRDNCVHTAEGDLKPWWQVDLGRQFLVSSISIWARTGFVSRLYPFNITVDGALCVVVGLYPDKRRRVNVWCQQPIYGREVRITRASKNHYDSLNMCEFKIWVDSRLSQCDAGWYGSTCKTPCSSNCRLRAERIFCYAATGQCAYGCVDGHYGDRCEEDCSDNCDTRTCDRTSGNCRCKLGYQPPLCKQECLDGHYGDRCKEDCSDNCDTPVCDKKSGNCTCKPGYQPPLCKEECNDGQYGHNCGLNCSANCTDVCDKVSGNCTCTPGFMPPLCDQVVAAELKDDAKSLTWPIVGAASGGGLLLAGIVTVIVCWRRRRQAKRSNNGGQNVSSAFELSPPFAKDSTKGSVEATEKTSSTHNTVGGCAVPEESGENYEPFYVSENYDAVNHIYTDMQSLPRNMN